MYNSILKSLLKIPSFHINYLSYITTYASVVAAFLVLCTISVSPRFHLFFLSVSDTLALFMDSVSLFETVFIVSTHRNRITLRGWSNASQSHTIINNIIQDTMFTP